MLQLGTTRSWLLLLLLGFVSVPEAAVASDCEKATTQREIGECSRAEFKNVSRTLDAAYNRYWESLTIQQRGLLGKAQEAWRRYRDANCEASAAVYAGGSMAATELVACKSLLTRERLAELKRIYEEPPHPPSQ